MLARTTAIKAAPFLSSPTDIEGLRQSSHDIYAWIVENTEAETARLKDIGSYTDLTAISIKYQGAVKDAVRFIKMKDIPEPIDIPDMLSLAETLYRISDAAENMTVPVRTPSTDAEFDQAALTRAEHTGIPYNPPSEQPEPAEANTGPSPDATENDAPHNGAGAVNGYSAYDPSLEIRQNLIERIEEAAAEVGVGDRAALDKVIKNAENSYPQAEGLDDLDEEQLRLLLNDMDQAILKKELAKA